MSTGQGLLLPTVSHGLHRHSKGLGVGAVGVSAPNPPPQHVAGPESHDHSCSLLLTTPLFSPPPPPTGRTISLLDLPISRPSGAELFLHLRTSLPWR